MKKIKTFSCKYIVIFSLLLISSCSDSLEEINVNPNQSVENPSVDLLFGSILPGFVGQLISSYNTPGQLSQQFAVKNSEVGILTHDEDAISRRFWEIVYSENNGALRNASFLAFEAKNQENQVYEAIGLIYKVYILSYTTDLFGDVPYIDAAQGFRFEERFIFPKYDAQTTIYESMINDLEIANDLLSNSPDNQTIDESRDLLFEGDKMSWRKFANTLQLRLLMRISNVQNVSADVSKIFSDPTTYPILESIEDEPMFLYETLTEWPFNSDRANIDDVRLSATMVDIMKGEGGINKIADEQDPRLSFLIAPTANSITAEIPEFVGQPVGIASDIEENENRSLLSSNFQNLNKFWLITYAELLFIKAEAIHRGFVSGNANTLLIDGVRASLNRYEIDPSSTESMNYLTSISDNFLGNEIKQIAIQRWMDQVNNGFEGYSVWRRLNFPVLAPGRDAVITEIPTRYFYSSKTTDKNQANADEAINRSPLNGVNTTFQKVWWDTE